MLQHINDNSRVCYNTSLVAREQEIIINKPYAENGIFSFYRLWKCESTNPMLENKSLVFTGCENVQVANIFSIVFTYERSKASAGPFLVPKRQFSTRTAREFEATPRVWKCAVATIYFFHCFYLWKGWRSPPAHFWSPNGNFPLERQRNLKRPQECENVRVTFSSVFEVVTFSSVFVFERLCPWKPKKNIFSVVC